jgi:REP element-mobilizing transposase RayT
MPRIPRHLIKGDNRCYHVLSRTAGQQFLLEEPEKEFLLKRIRFLSTVYCVRVFTFAILSNHFHLLIQMEDASECSEEELQRRFQRYYGSKKPFPKEKAEHFRVKWSDLSEFVKEIKQGFSRWYNRQNNRQGTFWSERFKSPVVQTGEALLSCMAYIDLNAVRANLVNRPEDYRFCGLGYHMRGANGDGFLCTDIAELSDPETPYLGAYRRYVYEVGSVASPADKRSIPQAISEVESQNAYRLSRTRLFRFRSRYFTESVALGSREFVRGVYANLRTFLKSGGDRDPIRIKGLEGLYSLRRLRDEVQ